MIKKILIIVGYGILFTIVIMTVLILTQHLLLDRIVGLIMKIRGTADYEGEEKGTEVWNIILGMIVPAVFLITLTMVALFRRKRWKG